MLEMDLCFDLVGNALVHYPAYWRTGMHLEVSPVMIENSHRLTRVESLVGLGILLMSAGRDTFLPTAYFSVTGDTTLN